MSTLLQDNFGHNILLSVNNRMIDAIAISDLHLGSDVCQSKLLGNFLEKIHEKVIATKNLILNGDIFDDWNFKRLKKRHWHVLSVIRKLSDHVRVIWINGNHDGPAELISHLLGVDVLEEFVLESGSKKVLFFHGHKYDTFIDQHPILTYISDWIYWLLIKCDRSFTLAKNAKKTSKHFLRNSEIIQSKSIEYAIKQNCDIVCAGHTHDALEFQDQNIQYFNSGCWTELPCNYLTVDNGVVRLHSYLDEVMADKVSDPLNIEDPSLVEMAI